MRIAVIGSGIAGLGAARALAARADVELFEAAPRAGGHARTVTVRPGVAVDMGFIIYSEPTYPRFTRLLAELGVATRAADMSFSAACAACHVEWGSGGLRALLAGAWGRGLPARLALLYDVVACCRTARRAVARGVGGEPIGAWTRRVPDAAARHFLLPMAGAVWSAAPRDITSMPAEVLLRFFASHGMFDLAGAPAWRTIVGGSRSYVDRLVGELGGRVHINTRVMRVVRGAGAGVTLELARGPARRFDRVVLATHADSALALLAGDASAQERAALGAFRYSRNRAVLHRDSGLMPRARAAWSSWNHRVDDCRAPEAALQATYWMNRLQGLAAPETYLVTLNPARTPAGVIDSVEFAHPLLDAAALRAQRQLAALQGVRATYFCGAYHGHGFHEDGLRAGQEVAALLLGARAREAA